MNDNKIKHLEMIQGVIERMARNSFMLKGWTLTLISGILALSFNSNNLYCHFIAYIPLIAFWFLDSYYLLEERLYRSLYEKVRNTNVGNIDFSLKATQKEFNTKKNKLISCLFSKTILIFYGSIALISFIITLFIMNEISVK